MTTAFWDCPVCETSNPGTTTVCGNCSTAPEAGELTGAGHLKHLAASITSPGSWRLSDVGPGFVEVAARSREVAEQKGAALLRADAYPDQSITVVSVRSHGWLVYVRSALTPYPSAVPPRQLNPARKPPRPARVKVRAPTEGRMYLGQVLTWSGDTGVGSIACVNRGLGQVLVRRADLAGQRTELSAGQTVCFYIEQNAGEPFAVAVIGL